MLKRLLILIKVNYILNIKYPFFIQYQIRHRMLCSYENKTKNNPKKKKSKQSKKTIPDRNLCAFLTWKFIF